LVDVGRQQRGCGRDTGIVDQHRDAGVGAQQCFDPAKIGLVVEVRRDDANRSARLLVKAAGRIRTVAAAR
jgi:hypothetical protein